VSGDGKAGKSVQWTDLSRERRELKASGRDSDCKLTVY
jgi:hypothetical protein